MREFTLLACAGGIRRTEVPQRPSGGESLGEMRPLRTPAICGKIVIDGIYDVNLGILWFCLTSGETICFPLCKELYSTLTALSQLHTVLPLKETGLWTAACPSPFLSSSEQPHASIWSNHPRYPQFS